MRKLKLVFKLKQLLEIYGKDVEIPELLSNESVSVYGLTFIEAVKKNEPWVDEAVEAYLESQDFLKDLQNAEKDWSSRDEYNDYWLQLECDSTRKIHLIVDMDLKV